MPLNDEFFAHYGIKGMKWGVRKDGSRTGRKRKGERTTLSKKAASLSDEELSKRTKRLNLEKRYIDLKAGKLKRDRTAIQKGKDEIKSMIGKAAQKQLETLTKEVVRKATDEGIKRGSKAYAKRKARKTLRNAPPAVNQYEAVYRGMRALELR